MRLHFGILVCAMMLSLVSCSDDVEEQVNNNDDVEEQVKYNESDWIVTPWRTGGAKYVFDNLFVSSSKEAVTGSANGEILIYVPEGEGVYEFEINSEATFMTYTSASPKPEEFGPYKVPETLHCLPFLVVDDAETPKYYTCTKVEDGFFFLSDSGELVAPFVTVLATDDGFALDLSACESGTSRRFEVYIALCKDIKESVNNKYADFTEVRLIVCQR